EQLYTFGDPGRDPRGRTISVAYYALLARGESRPHLPVPGEAAAADGTHGADQASGGAATGRTAVRPHDALSPAPGGDTVGADVPAAGRGVTEAAWHAVWKLPALAFDHDRIARYAHRRLQQKLTYAPLAFRVLPEPFTMGQLRAVHEAI